MSALTKTLRVNAAIVLAVLYALCILAPLGTQCEEDIRCFEDRALLVVCNAPVVRSCRDSERVCGGSMATIVR